MRRTLILSAVGATAMLIGLGVGAALATTDPVQSSPIAAHMMMADCPGATGSDHVAHHHEMSDHAAHHQEMSDHAAHHQDVQP